MVEKFVYICSCFFSCGVGVILILQFLDDRYRRAYDKKWIYRVIPIITILVITLINQMQKPFWNMSAFFLSCAILSGPLYSGGRLKAYGRIMETVLFYILLGIIEGVGGYLISLVMEFNGPPFEAEALNQSVIVVFSKVILLFLYYLLLRRFWKRDWGKITREYVLYLVMVIYSMINMTVIVMGQNSVTRYIVLGVNFTGLILANIYSFYYMRMSDENEKLDFQLTLMKQQENLQFEYYKMQKEKYDRSISILHDVSKHIRSIEELYKSNQTEEALAYTKEINDILKPMIPVRYSDNPMFDILLTDQKYSMENQGISLQLE